MPGIILAESAAPSTPSTGYVHLYAKSDGLLYWKDDSGTEHDVEPAATPDATTSVKGIVELATDAEVETGTDTTRVAPVSAMGKHVTACKAWVNFNGTGTVAIRDSFNVTSITDNGTGDYTVNFTNALANANYTSFVTVGGTVGGLVGKNADQDTPRTTSLVRVNAVNTSNALQDNAVMCVAVFGD